MVVPLTVGPLPAFLTSRGSTAFVPSIKEKCRGREARERVCRE